MDRSDWINDELTERRYEVIDIYDGDEVRRYVDDVHIATFQNPHPGPPYTEFRPSDSPPG